MKKKTVSLLLVALLLISALCGCGAAKGAPSEASASYAQSTTYDMAGAYDNGMMEETAAAEAPAAAPDSAGGIAAQEGGAAIGEMSADKIIYSASARVETTDYEQALEAVYALVERCGGFVESSSISGNDYYVTARGGKTFRTANFTLRIPSSKFQEVTGALSELGNVPYCNTYSQNVTAAYYDVQSRIDAYKTQETRLLEMLEIANTVEDMLAIQQQLTEVQYQIDSYSSTLTNYDRQVNYSSIDLNVCEVEEYTEQPTVQVGYWEKMQTGFFKSLQAVGDFFQDLLLWLVSNMPMILLVVAIALVCFWILRGIVQACRGGARQSRAERRAARCARREAKKTAKAAKKAGSTEPGTPSAPAEPKDEN